ncbi:hypothetical protein DYB32_002589 [Aphanomyces invadans]|uniref:GAF domain-containing protein n=1 Tax=Aphanomyces invadans TaxID=157072 RepID=A0A418B321_9STRA|nr:hypothetical protein DYB32_002589 [Aphanomyces invadans]
MLAPVQPSPASSHDLVDAPDELDDAVRLQDILAPAHWVDKRERVACGDCGLKFSNFHLCQHKVFVKICKACSVEETGTASSSTTSSVKSPRHQPHDTTRASASWRSMVQTGLSKSSPSLRTQHPLEQPLAGTGSTAQRQRVDVQTNETDRLDVVHGYNIDYTADPHDDILQLCQDAAAAYMCPIAAVSVMEADVQHVVASIGIALRTIPRDVAWMCDTVVSTNRPLVVLDAMQDARYRHCDLVQNDGIRFYAAVPVANMNGWVLGTLAVMATTPREHVDIAPLVALAAAVMTHLRRTKARTRRKRTLSCGSAERPSPDQGLRLQDSNSESLVMSLLAKTTQTQVSLAQQQTAMATTLGDHSNKISQLVQAIERMETMLCDDIGA